MFRKVRIDRVFGNAFIVDFGWIPYIDAPAGFSKKTDADVCANAGGGKGNSRGARAVLVGERTQQDIVRRLHALGKRRFDETDRVVLQNDVPAGRNDEEMFRRQRKAIRRVGDRPVHIARKELDQPGLGSAVLMLHEDKGVATTQWHGPQQGPAGIEFAG
nr:hypothetical protein [Shinella sumterensis]